MNNPTLDAPRRARIRAPRTTPASHCAGIVTAREGSRFTVISGEVEFPARRAASCLLEPEAGDTVACLEVAPREFWIVAVLLREEGVKDVLRFQRDARVETAGESLALEARSLRVAADDAEIIAERARWTGNEFRAVGKAFKIVGALLSTVFERATHYSQHHLRTTEGLDRVQARHLQQQAGHVMQLSAEHTLINGEKLVKTRGDQIHFG